MSAATVRTHTLAGLPIGAASGIARVGETLAVVADDENALVLTDLDGRNARRVPFAGGGTDSKAAKRDLEALACFGGRLLALPSGSTERRRTAFAWSVPDGTAPVGEPEPVDIAPLYERIERSVPDLNIEGATFAGELLLLFQRGNGAAGVNAVVELRSEADGEQALHPGSLERVERYDLGSVEGVRLCFTDAACAGDTVIFTAVAEAGDSTYHDGECVGAAVGILGGPLFALERPVKVEGVEVARMDDDGIDLLLVADDDDPRTRAQLMSARIPLA